MSKNSLIVKTKSLPKSRIAIELEIPSSSCKECLEDSLKTISRSAKIPGFRVGKIPKQVLIQRIGITQLYASALEKLIDKSWNEALQLKSIEPLCEPELVDGFENLIKKFNPESNLKLILETDVAPALKLKQTKNLTVEFNKSKFDPKSVDEALEKTRHQMANIVPVDSRPAQMGDIAVVSFSGIYKKSKEAIEGGSSESMDLELEQNKMIPGFVEGIVGMKINQSKKLTLKFPDDYPHEDSKGKEAIFEVLLKDLKTKELPELNDDFAKQSGNKNTLKEFKKEIEDQLKLNFESSQQNLKEEAIIDALANELEVDLPKSMIDVEVRNSIEQTAQRFAQQGLDVKSTFTPELIKSLAESSRPQAEKNLKRNLSIKALAEQEKISVQDKEIDFKMESYKEEIKKAPNKIDLNKLREVIKNDLIKERSILWLEENAKITEKVAKPKTTKKTPTKSSSKKSTKTKNSSKAKEEEKK